MKASYGARAIVLIPTLIIAGLLLFLFDTAELGR